MVATAVAKPLLALCGIACSAARVVPTSRSMAHAALLRVRQHAAFADRALSAAFLENGRALTPVPRAERARATEIVYGVLRHERALDAALDQLTNLSRADPATRMALRIGAYEILKMRTAEHAAVNEARAAAIITSWTLPSPPFLDASPCSPTGPHSPVMIGEADARRRRLSSLRAIVQT